MPVLRRASTKKGPGQSLSRPWRVQRILLYFTRRCRWASPDGVKARGEFSPGLPPCAGADSIGRAAPGEKAAERPSIAGTRGNNGNRTSLPNEIFIPLNCEPRPMPIALTAPARRALPIVGKRGGGGGE